MKKTFENCPVVIVDYIQVPYLVTVPKGYEDLGKAVCRLSYYNNASELIGMETIICRTKVNEHTTSPVFLWKSDTPKNEVIASAEITLQELKAV